MKQSNRRVVVFATLISVLSLTSALLLALAPAPLTPDASSSLFAIDTPQSMDAIFRTTAPVQPGRWKYIYIHHSLTAGGNALAFSRGAEGLSDHFVIGNGDGAVDGEIQIGQRWMEQTPAAPPMGATGINPACISIRLVGNFDRSVPTATQLHRLALLVQALQGKLDIPAGQVVVLNQPDSEAGIGKFFPITAFREQLLP